MTIEELEIAIDELANYAEAQAQRLFAEAVEDAQQRGEYHEGARRYREILDAIVEERHRVYVEGLYALLQQTEEETRPSAWQIMVIGAVSCLGGLLLVVAILGWLVWMQS